MNTLLSHPPALPRHLTPLTTESDRCETEGAIHGDLDYGVVQQYWHKATPSLLGPYVMDGFGFPADAGQFRLNAEFKIAARMIRDAG